MSAEQARHKSYILYLSLQLSQILILEGNILLHLLRHFLFKIIMHSNQFGNTLLAINIIWHKKNPLFYFQFSFIGGFILSI